MEFFNSDLFTYAILPVLIFCSRIIDVSIGTVRLILLSKGHKYIAPLLGFFEVLIWLTAISRIMQNLDNVFCFIAYAGGFATGNFIGMKIEERLALGSVIIRVICKLPADDLMNMLNEKGFGATYIKAQGNREEVCIIYTVVKRTAVNQVIEIINRFNPNAFYSIEDVKYVNQGVFPEKKNSYNSFSIFKRWRTGK